MPRSLLLTNEFCLGFGQPFVLSAPAYYSDIWFSSKGRITANALISLSNPLGAAVIALKCPSGWGHLVANNNLLCSSVNSLGLLL